MVDKWPNATLNRFQTVPNPMLFIRINLTCLSSSSNAAKLTGDVWLATYIFIPHKFFNEIVKPIEPFSRIAYLHN